MEKVQGFHRFYEEMNSNLIRHSLPQNLSALYVLAVFFLEKKLMKFENWKNMPLRYG